MTDLFNGDNKICEAKGRGGVIEIFRVEGGYSIRKPGASKPLKLQDLPVLAQLLLEAFHLEIQRRKR